MTPRMKTAATVLMLTVASFMVGFQIADTDLFFKINKSIDIFGRVYHEVTMNYVDQIDPEKFMEAGIDGMLGTLDPYTDFISEKEAGEVELITAGKYGGIGVTIGLRDGYITVIATMEGYSAQRQGIQAGDRIIEIDGKQMSGATPDVVRTLTRGEPGTDVHLKIEREGEPKPLEFVVVREEIQLKNITYADFVQGGIAYVQLQRFTRGAGDELRLALRELKLRGDIRGIILDLRDNPGGLLDVAVDVVEKFAAKGSLVVSTRGRKPDTEKKYYVTEEPMLPDVPLVVLVNRGSASASEIVAGAIQDLDRGVILGSRTFGKGLVQTITPLPYNTQLKMTTAKYYTPSGRCIQEIDYMHKNRDGVFAVTPDSLKQKFETKNGRPEFASGGIQPDTLVPDVVHSALHSELLRKSMYFKFATRFASLHTTLPTPIASDSLLLSFRQYLKESNFTYQDEGEAKLKELSQIAEKAHYDTDVKKEIEDLAKKLGDGSLSALDRNKDEIGSALRGEIMSRYKGERGKIEESLTTDVQVSAAVGVLEDGKLYKHLLKPR